MDLAVAYPSAYLNSVNQTIPSLKIEGLAGLANGIAMTLGLEPANVQQNPVTAIDIALEPDQTMLGHARSANAALLKNFPGGFSLDATHHPHISIFAGFIPTADLPKVYAVAE
jgi:hypothetical protein